LSPVTADEDVTGEDHTLGLLFEEINEVARDEIFGVSWGVRDSWEEYRLTAVSGGNSIRVKSG